LKLNPGEV
jgi:superkiller protein 3